MHEMHDVVASGAHAQRHFLLSMRALTHPSETNSRVLITLMCSSYEALSKALLALASRRPQIFMCMCTPITIPDAGVCVQRQFACAHALPHATGKYMYISIDSSPIQIDELIAFDINFHIYDFDTVTQPHRRRCV